MPKIEKLAHFWPTGYFVIDIMLGENIRDQQGNLVDHIRGFNTLGKQYALAALQGTGKSTFIADASSFPIHIGMADCIHKIIIIDTDNASWDVHRLVKCTNLPPEIIKEKYVIINEQDIGKITSMLKDLSAEYTKAKLSPVKFFDPYLGVEREMMPAVMIALDTVTSVSSTEYVEKDALAKQQGLTTFLDVSNLANNISNLFQGNSVTLWCAHLKENTPKIGQTVADKEFKSAPGKWKSHIPVRVKQKVSSFLWFTKTLDMENTESNSHPIQVYGLQDMKTKSVYITNAITVKSRTGTEGRTVGKLAFVNGTFDRTLSLLTSALDLKLFDEGSGQHPSAANPSIFKDRPLCQDEYAAQGRRSKKILTLKGYDRPTNIIEARLLLNYAGEDEEILEKAQEMREALMNRLDEVLFYELEVNNVTAEELKTNQDKIRSLLGFIRSTNKEKKTIKKSDLDAATPDKKDEYL